MSKPNDIMKELAGLTGGNDQEATVDQWLDTGFPPLNHASSSNWDNGLPVGRVIEIAGPPSAGKTAIATMAMVAAQKAGGVAAFEDHERSFSFSQGERVGLDTKSRFIYKKPRTFEESIGIYHVSVKGIRDKKLIAPSAPICWVFDSLASMVPQSALFDKDGKDRSADSRNMNDNTALARATSAHFAGIAMIADEYGVCVIFLNQLRTDITVKFGDPRKATGGNTPGFTYSQRIWLNATQIKDAKSTEIIGNEVTAKFMKNKIARPFREVKWRFMYQPDGSGRFDFERSMLDFMADEKLLEPAKRSGYFVWEGTERTKEQIARIVEAEGAAGFAKLKALLPVAYTPPVIAEVVIEADDEAA